MLATEVDRGNIEKMVRSFYERIVEDDVVGPYFTKALGEDLKNDKWYDHHRTLDKFWLMMMTGEKGYAGDPFLPHVFIGKLYPETFDRWLELFDEVVNQHFTPEISQKFYKKAEILSKKFIDMLEEFEEDE